MMTMPKDDIDTNHTTTRHQTKPHQRSQLDMAKSLILSRVDIDMHFHGSPCNVASMVEQHQCLLIVKHTQNAGKREREDRREKKEKDAGDMV